MHSRAYVHACATALLPLIGVGAWMGGRDVAFSTALAGVAVFVHLLVGEGIFRRFVATAAGQSDPSAVGQLMLRQLTTVPLALVLIATVGALPTALVCTSLGLGAFVLAVVSALHSADARSLLVPSEATC